MKIITSVVNNIDFLRIQHKTFAKYMRCNYEFIVVNDAKPYVDFTNAGDITLRQQFVKVCKELNIKCINYPNDHHREILSASLRCAEIMNFILGYIKKYPDKYLVVDSDMFLVDYFDPMRYDGIDCAIVLQNRCGFHYFLNGIHYFDSTRIKDINLMNWSLSGPSDVGGAMNPWLMKQMDGKELPSQQTLREKQEPIIINNIYFIPHLWSLTFDESEYKLENAKLLDFMKKDLRNESGKFYCEIYDNIFLHFRGISNWEGRDPTVYKHLTKEFVNVFDNHFFAS